MDFEAFMIFETMFAMDAFKILLIESTEGKNGVGLVKVCR